MFGHLPSFNKDVLLMVFLFCPVPGIFCVIAGDRNHVRVQNVNSQGKYDLVTTEWLLKCLELCELVPWTPDDLISMSPDTSNQMALLFDAYGDSFTKPSTLHSLDNCLRNIQKMVKFLIFFRLVSEYYLLKLHNNN